MVKLASNMEVLDEAELREREQAALVAAEFEISSSPGRPGVDVLHARFASMEGPRLKKR